MCYWCEERLCVGIVVNDDDEMVALCETCADDPDRVLTRDEVARRLFDGGGISFDTSEYYTED